MLHSSGWSDELILEQRIIAPGKIVVVNRQAKRKKAKKPEGWTLNTFKDKLLNRVQAAGWSGATASRLKVIYDTNMQMAFSQGKYKQQKLISDLYPYWKYTQIERPTKRHNHSLLHNKVFRHDDPIWDLIYPPSGFGCKCSVTPIKDCSNVEDGSR